MARSSASTCEGATRSAASGASSGAGGQAEIGAEIEEIVLDPRQRRLDRGERRLLGAAGVQPREADRAIGFVDVAHRREARVVLRPARPVAEPALALVSRARVDDVQPDHGGSVCELRRGPSSGRFAAAFSREREKGARPRPRSGRG